jgi:hypothetical protein
MAERTLHAFVGDDTQKRKLSKLHSRALAEPLVKNRVARQVESQ